MTLNFFHAFQNVTYPNYEIIVIDDRSTGGSAERIEEEFPSVRLHKESGNLWWAKAMNLGVRDALDRNADYMLSINDDVTFNDDFLSCLVKLAEQNPRTLVGALIYEHANQNKLRFAGASNVGMKYALEHGAELICLLNNDTTVDKDFLKHLVSRLQSGNTIGMVAPKIYYHDEPNRIWFAGGEMSMWTGTMKHTGIREEDAGQYNTSKEIDYTTGCCILTRKEVVEKVGMLDESYFMYTEDADWSMHVRRAGYKIVYEPKARVWHKLSVTSGGHLSFFKMKNKFISNLRFFFRYATLPQKLVFPWMNVLVNGWAAGKYLNSTKKQ